MLTATIDPGGTPMVVRRNCEERHRDYCEALNTWLQSGIRTIVFVENSGHDLTQLKTIAGRYPEVHTEFVALSPDANTATLGKGFGELTMIESAFNASAVLRNAGHIAKCTGRLTVINIANLLNNIEGLQSDIFCTLKNNLTFADSRFFVARPSIFLNNLIGKKHFLNDHSGMFFENILARAATEAVSQGCSWTSFPVLPYVAGISGTFGTRMTDRPWTRATKAVYHALRRYVYQH